MSSIPKTIGDFVLLPIQMPPRTAADAPPTHILYVRRNAPKIPTADDARSLFLANVPVDSTEAHFRALFAALVGPGRFETITFEDERRRRRADGEGVEDGEEEDDDDDDDEDDALDRLEVAQLSRKRKRSTREQDAARLAVRRREAAAAERARAQLPAAWARAPLRRSGSTAVAVLADEKSVELVLRAVARGHKGRGGQWPVWGVATSGGEEEEGVAAVTAGPAALGPAWLAAHARLAYPAPAALRASVDAFFARYNRREAAAAARVRRLRNVPDADGFVTVTRGGGGAASAFGHTSTSSGARGGAGAVARQAAAQAARAKQEAKQAQQAAERTHFYRFQLREHKKAEQAELLRRFQEDRQRVAAMRAKRGKFQPEA